MNYRWSMEDHVYNVPRVLTYGSTEGVRWRYRRAAAQRAVVRRSTSQPWRLKKKKVPLVLRENHIGGQWQFLGRLVAQFSVPSSHTVPPTRRIFLHPIGQKSAPLFGCCKSSLPPSFLTITVKSRLESPTSLFFMRRPKHSQQVVVSCQSQHLPVMIANETTKTFFFLTKTPVDIVIMSWHRFPLIL